MTNFELILKKLVEAEVRFVLVGGLAAVTYGSAYETSDLDICYERGSENIGRLVSLLRGLKARLRGVPANVPFQLDDRSIKNGLNFTFVTILGDLDILGEIAGVGDYKRVAGVSEPIDLFGIKVNVLSLDALIKAKKASNRPKDQLHLKELEAIREMKGRV